MSTILIVEDNEKNMKLVRDILRHRGHETIEAVTGEEGVRLAVERRPDLVLMDIQLPGLDGFAVAERLAAAPDGPAVVLISSRGAEAFYRRLAASPARGFIAKSDLSGACLASLLS